jgi:NADH-quinone oxidoreductase subunit G
MADLEIEIDGKKLTAKPNQTVIQVADEAGIYIPRFCYHKHLSIPANCRMCLVEVEKMPKAVPACATPCAPGMKVFTKSQKTVLAQRAVMEFLLINHPLDCPICDQGGECELQDLSMGYGSSDSAYNECKHSVADENLGPLIATEMTRCIKCTRCVRFGDEIAGMRELGVVGRGEDTDISTYIQEVIRSEVSGNIIDLCPVGALTSKPYRFTARAWELDQFPGISSHDCLGSNLNVHSRYGKVMRVVSRENLTINETWVSDRDRYSYTGLYHQDRLEEPMILEDGKWQVTTWQHALEVAASGLREIVDEQGADKLGAVASPNSTTEEFYLLQKIIRTLGSPHIDHRLRETDTQDQDAMALYPGLNIPLTELEQSDAIVLIGSNIQHEQPLLSLRLRKAIQNGAKIIVVNPVDYTFNFKVDARIIVAPQHLPEAIKDISKELAGKSKTVILLGALALNHPQASLIRYEAQQIANAKIGYLTSGANSAGAWIAGAIPHRHAGGDAINHAGLSAYCMFEKPRKAYVLLNVEPDLDCANTQHATDALSQANFVVALSMYHDPVIEKHANVILPISAFTETSGTYVNTNGEWQSFTGAATPLGSSRPAWKVLRVLANFLHLENFNYESSEAVKHELKTLLAKTTVKPVAYKPQAAQKAKEGLYRIGEIPIYSTDSLVRRAIPLQATQEIMSGPTDALRVHPETADKHQLRAGESVRVHQQNTGVVKMPVVLDERIAKDAVWIAGGIPATRHLGELFAKVEIEKK